MSQRFLLDTNAVSEMLRPNPNQAFVERLKHQESACVIASPVWHELVFGAERLPRSKKRRAIESFLREVVKPSFPILPYDDAAADHHARERARLVAQGRTPSFVDGQIASVTFTRGLILVTSNVSDFERFEGLEIEDWRN